jgi:hypothetical protein
LPQPAIPRRTGNREGVVTAGFLKNSVAIATCIHMIAADILFTMGKQALPVQNE